MPRGRALPLDEQGRTPLDREMAYRGITPRQIAEAAGVAYGTVTHAARGGYTLPETAWRMAAALQQFPRKPELVEYYGGVQEVATGRAAAS